MKLENRRVLVIGLARSGLAVAKLLRRMGATVIVNDSNTIFPKDAINDLKRYSIELISGNNSVSILERNFDFIVKNPGVNPSIPLVKEAIRRKIPIYTEIEVAYQLAKNNNYIAITGTNGKTTIATLTYEVLSAYHDHSYLAGNIGIALSDLVLEEELYRSSANNIVLEMSNFQLMNIDKFHPYISVICNLSPDHLDYMESLEEYYESKTNIYRNQIEGDYYILNLDDENVIEYSKAVKANIIEFSLNKKTNGCYLLNGYIFYQKEMIIKASDLKIVGDHNIANAMIAIIIAKILKVPNAVIEYKLANFKGVEHRIEFVKEVAGVKYYNDSKATNLNSTTTALKSFKEPVILLLGGKDKGLDLQEIKPYLSNVKQVIGFGAAGKRMATVKEGSLIASNLKEATYLARDIAASNEVVLLSPGCSSYDEFTDFEHRGKEFKKIVNSF